MDDAMHYFYDQKKSVQLQLKHEWQANLKKVKRNDWAAKLKALDSFEKPCCRKMCLNGGIPTPVLERTRKVIALLGNEMLTHGKRCSNKMLHFTGFLVVQQPVRQEAFFDSDAWRKVPFWFCTVWWGIPIFLERAAFVVGGIKRTPAGGARNSWGERRPYG